MDKHSVSLRLAILGALGTAGVSTFQQAAAEPAHDSVEEVTVVGSRRANAVDTVAPVDVISAAQFESVGAPDMDNMLRSLVPSYNVAQQPINDESTLVRPANLRGLPPDNTLVLVNGKRRHRGGVITFLGDGISDGAQGPDVGPIPTIALKEVQVLRDGAAAQYGSDAIAGVINFQLKDSAEGTAFEARYGQYFEGDGATSQLAANMGLPLGANGFANLTFEYSESDPTSRSAQRSDAQAIINAGNTAILNPAQVWGQPEIKDSMKFFVNTGYEFSESLEGYFFGNYATREVDGGFFYRNPNTRAAVYSNDGGASLLVADLNPNNAISCPAVPIANNAPNPAALALISAGGALDSECFVFNELFPGGFTPRFGGKIVDQSAVAGLRGDFANGLRYDVSGSYGSSEVDFLIYNTVNASLGPNTPTRFKPGINHQTDTNFNVDMAYPLAVSGLASPLNVAFGFEWREEEFEVERGQLESYQIGPYASQGFSSGSNGFSGYGPQSEGVFSRENIALYVDLEADVTDKLILGTAVRWEDFDDFGTTTNFKVAARYELTDSFAIRSTVSTGFRAPTPGQANIVRTITQMVNGNLTETGVLPPTNPIAAALANIASGGEFTASPLKPEESFNWTLGTAFDIGPVGVTLDYFNITLEDRIALSSLIDIDRTDPAQLAILNQLSASGVPGASTLTAFQFFTNDFETETQGVDLVATLPFAFAGGQSSLILAFNWTDTQLKEITALADATRKIQLEDQLPGYRAILTGSHSIGPWSFMARTSYYDSYVVALDIGADASGEFDGKYGGELLVDLEVSYKITDGYRLSVGAQDIFDNVPDQFPNPEINSGAIYPTGSPMGFNGGFWYARLNVDF
ncbi:MAG TPA: TonB-dependent receptor [Steroidobacter sp.]